MATERESRACGLECPSDWEDAHNPERAEVCLWSNVGQITNCCVSRKH